MSTMGPAGPAEQPPLLGGGGYAVISADEHGRVTLLNPEAEDLTGWTDNDARGKPLAEVFHLLTARGGTHCADLAVRVLSGGTASSLADHDVLVARGGAKRRVTGKGCPMRDAAGRIMGLVLLFRDVDQASRMQAALLEGETLTRSISHHLPDLRRPRKLNAGRRTAFADVAEGAKS